MMTGVVCISSLLYIQLIFHLPINLTSHLMFNLIIHLTFYPTYHLIIHIKIHQIIHLTIHLTSVQRILQLNIAKGGKITPTRHVNLYNFIGFKDFLSKLWGHLDKSNTQVRNVKYF